MGNETRNTRTAVTGIALILAGVLMLGVQMSSAFAGRLTALPGERPRQIGCGGDIVPFDSYQKYMPHVVRFAFPLGDQVAEFKLEFENAVTTAVAEARAVFTKDGTEAAKSGHRTHEPGSASTI